MRTSSSVPLQLSLLLALLHPGASTSTASHTLLPSPSRRPCSYNGAVDHTTQTCRCDAAWHGPACSTLALLPAAKGGGFRSPYEHEASKDLHSPHDEVSSWGGSVLFDSNDGKWHMFSAEMANH